MTYRDDLEAALQRNRSLEEEHREEQRKSELELAAQKLEIAALKAKRRESKRPDRNRRVTVSGGFRRGVGFVSIVLALVGLVFMCAVFANWSPYIQKTSAALEEAGRGNMVGAMVTLNFVMMIWFVLQSLALVAIGFGQVNDRTWASKSALLWSVLCFVYLALEVVCTTLVEGKAWDWTTALLLLFYPVFLLLAHKRLK